MAVESVDELFTTRGEFRPLGPGLLLSREARVALSLRGKVVSAVPYIPCWCKDGMKPIRRAGSCACLPKHKGVAAYMDLRNMGDMHIHDRNWFGRFLANKELTPSTADHETLLYASGLRAGLKVTSKGQTKVTAKFRRWLRPLDIVTASENAREALFQSVPYGAAASRTKYVTYTAELGGHGHVWSDKYLRHFTVSGGDRAQVWYLSG